MLVKETLIGVKKLLKDEKHWTKNAYAVNSSGKALPRGNSDFAVSWCLQGAVEKVTGGVIRDNIAAHQVLKENLPGYARSLLEFNDTPERTHAEILELLDTCLEKA